MKSPGGVPQPTQAEIIGSKIQELSQRQLEVFKKLESALSIAGLPVLEKITPQYLSDLDLSREKLDTLADCLTLLLDTTKTDGEKNKIIKSFVSTLE